MKSMNYGQVAKAQGEQQFCLVRERKLGFILECWDGQAWRNYKLVERYASPLAGGYNAGPYCDWFRAVPASE